MKIISWNCHYDFNTYEGFTPKKHQEIIEYRPDILIIYEITKNEFDKIKRNWNYRNWYNDDIKDKDSVLGVAIFSNDYEIKFTNHFNRNHRYIIPYQISWYKYEIYLFTVWTKKVPYYYENIFSAIDSHEYDDLLNQNSIIIGDFNTGLIKNFNGENTEKQKEHNLLYKKLLKKLIMLENCTLGTKDEFKITYFQNSKESYLNDFCFTSKNIKKDIVNITIPSGNNYWQDIKNKKYWKGLSDHCPIIVELK